ncbi:oligosaccharide flippase family protein [Bacillus sp. 1P02SD]|uniref:oligosaccharide flippase family protein n=1 Tax=Bacillus sp. 1P02SD TaxID=3132264 RepID=UPI0039A348EF
MNKLISNYLYTVLYQLLLILTPFITTPYVSRVLKPEGIGIDAYVLSIVQLFLVFAILSIPLYGSRQVATKGNQNDTSKEFWSIYSVQLCISLLTVAIYSILVFTIDQHKILFLVHIFTLIASLLDISWYFIGKEKIKSVTLRNILVRVVSIIMIFTLVKDIDDLTIYVMINAITLFVGQLIMWVPLLKEVRFVRVKFQDVKTHIVPILSLFIPQIMVQTYILVNRVVLGQVSGETEVGFYNQADKVVRIALGFITSLGTVLLPRMANEFAQGNKESMKKYIQYALQFVLIITLPMTFGLMGVAPNFISWFLGSDFAPVTHLLIIISPVIFFVGLANIFGIQILVATNQENKYSISITFGAILSLIINGILVFHIASTATAIALLVAEATGALIQMYFARNYFNIRHFIVLFSKYFILSVFVFGVVYMGGFWFSGNPIIITVLQIVIGGITYLLGLIIIRDTMVTRVLALINKKLASKG